MTDVPNTPNGAAPDPFDPRKLRVAGDIAAVGAEKILTRLLVRKPNKQEFFRVNPDPEMRLACAILDLKEEREGIYLVAPDIIPLLAEDVRQVDLRLCLNRQGVAFLWPVPMPGPDGRSNSWHESAREAAALAEASWIRMVASMSEGAYTVFRATGPIPSPEWPELTLRKVLELGFKDGRLIDTADHPILRQLRGE
jgi:hypothetical protein